MTLAEMTRTSAPDQPLPSAPAAPIRVFIACSGLGRIVRGYESFARECFDALAGVPDLDVMLFKGFGPNGSREKSLPHVPREWVSKLQRRFRLPLRRGAYFVEQATFSIALLPWVIRRRPEVVFFSDPVIGHVLRFWRKVSGQRFALLFSNGAPFSPPFRWDLVQQIASVHYESAVRDGQNAKTMELLPYGVQMPETFVALSPKQKADLRRRLGLPVDRPILISVGAVNLQKRMDYVIREVASLPEPRPFLLILGQREAETPAIESLATEILGADNFRIATVAADQVADYCRAADVFCLASLNETFGRVYVEALAQGLVCIGHDCQAVRYVLGKSGRVVNMALPGALSAAYSAACAQEDASPAGQARRHEDVRERFGWAQLIPAYVQMIRRAAELASE